MQAGAEKETCTTRWARRIVDRIHSTTSDSEALDPFNVVANSFVKVSLHLRAERRIAEEFLVLSRCARLCMLCAAAARTSKGAELRPLVPSLKQQKSHRFDFGY